MESQLLKVQIEKPWPGRSKIKHTIVAREDSHTNVANSQM